jgi:dipeptidyl aminopeptidase/acylaminoacyl peptidase
MHHPEIVTRLTVSDPTRPEYRTIMRAFLAVSALSFLVACAPALPASGPGPAPAAPAARAAYLDQLPPLIDRDIFFGDPEIAGGQVSPDGRYISFLRPLDGVLNVWVKGREEAFEAARPVTADTIRPVPSYFWSQDGQYVLYAQDRAGDENFRVYAVDPAAAPAAGSPAPPVRDLTPYEEVQARIVSVPQATPNHILVAINDRDPRVHDVYRIDIRTGERELVRRNDENVVQWQADLQGRLRLGVRQTQDGGWEILRVDADGLVPVYSCGWEDTCGPLRFHHDDQRAYMVTNRDADLTRLILFDPETGAEELVDMDPEGQVDFGGAEFSRATRELIATYYLGDRLRTYPKDPEFARDLERVRAAVHDGDIYFGSRTRDDRFQLINVTSDIDPGATYLYDRQTGRVELQYRPYPDLPTEHLAPMRPVRYSARDGLEIPAYLTVPRGVEARGLPVIILPHGGPWFRDRWGYDPFAQFLANRGYAVLQPNFRGSTGYGKRFLNLGNEEWGTGTMQDDITDGVRWLIAEGIADPDRVGIFGGSYGGYATLAGVAFTPELYAVGVPYVAPSNLITLIESFPPYWAPLIRLWHLRLGNPDDPEQRQRLVEQSPLFAVDRIRAPLLVVHGANDPRVVQNESDQIVVALRDRGVDVDYLVAPDEGHGFARLENRLALAAEMERFLARHLGGRYQSTVSPEIARRLEVLRVDVDTVTAWSTRVDAADPAAGAATGADVRADFRGGQLREGTLRYQQRIEMGGQSIEGTSTRTLAAGTWEGEPAWIAVEESRTSMGAGVDSTFLQQQTLLPLRRVIRQGPATIDVRYSDGAVEGVIHAGPQELPLGATGDGWILADGAPLEIALATLPLTPGYEAALQTFSILEGRTRDLRLAVGEPESIDVAAGTFHAFRLTLAHADGSGGGSTIWVERDAPHRILRVESRLPAQLGAGRATTELAP